MTHEQRRQLRESIVKRISSGEISIAEAIKETGRSPSTIYDWVKEAGLPNVVQRRSVGSLEIIADLQNTKWTTVTIAKRRGVSKQRVSAILQDAIRAGIRFSARRYSGQK